MRRGDDDTGSAAGANAGSGSGSDLEPISLTFGTAGMPVVCGSIVMHVADEEGLPDKYALDVTFQNFANGTDSTRRSSAGLRRRDRPDRAFVLGTRAVLTLARRRFLPWYGR